jgi:hypothetical protein
MVIGMMLLADRHDVISQPIIVDLDEMFLDAVDIHAYALKKESIRSHHDLRGQQLEQFEQEILMILPWRLHS